MSSVIQEIVETFIVEIVYAGLVWFFRGIKRLFGHAFHGLYLLVETITGRRK